MHDIRCPCCTRKLMTIRISESEAPEVMIVGKREDQQKYDMVTRCPLCKAYVGYKIKIIHGICTSQNPGNAR